MCALSAALARLLSGALGALDSLEAMLEAQIIAAVGKRVGADDFAQYMAWHNERLFRTEFRPTPFSVAVRRPGRAPCGTVAIEGDGGAGADAAIRTTVVEQGRSPMRFALNAAADVELRGSTFLHSAVLQVSVLLFTVTLCANRAHSFTRSP